MGWPSVQEYQDGVDRVDAKTLNRPLNQLIERTDYLKRLVEANDHQKVVASGIEFSTLPDEVVPAPGQPVYRVPENGTYALAAAAVGENKWFYADEQAMAVGIVGADVKTVVLYGYVEFGKVGSGNEQTTGIDVWDVIVDKNPASGRYFLSATAGKLTAKPTGPVIYVCDCRIADGKVVSMFVSPQYRDTGESHVHRAFVVSGAPMGGYSAKVNSKYRVPGILPSGGTKSPTAMPAVSVLLYGYWAHSASVTYTIEVDGDSVSWTSGGVDGSGGGAVPTGTNLLAVGTHGLKIRFSGTGSPNGKTWTVKMPDAARAWVENGSTGFRLNLGMYPELLSYVPDNGVAMPVNGASLTVDGVDRAGPLFGAQKGWSIEPADGDGGPWLVWYDAATPVIGDVTATAPFIWADPVSAQRDRDIVLYLNRMRVGPTGFVTSLQAAPGSPLRVTSVQTGASAMQGALMLGLDVDFKSAEGNAEGSQVVKRIEGNTFITGQVVERIVEGPGIAVNRQQGTVTVSASNAVYAGDFETIALKNAKQDLAGGVFPYTKLVAWRSGSGVTNVRSGFTAKFRVPDFIPYNAGKGYYVVVSASVFGEEGLDSGASAAFTLVGYSLADQACSVEASGSYSDSIASLSGGDSSTVYVPFADNYAAFDPVLVHGFAASAGQGPGELVLPNEDQRVRDDALWLKASNNKRMVVYPGYFVGVSIERCGVGDSEITPYEPAIGFLSLRWNLVAVQ